MKYAGEAGSLGVADRLVRQGVDLLFDPLALLDARGLLQPELLGVLHPGAEPGRLVDMPLELDDGHEPPLLELLLRLHEPSAGLRPLELPEDLHGLARLGGLPILHE